VCCCVAHRAIDFVVICRRNSQRVPILPSSFPHGRIAVLALAATIFTEIFTGNAFGSCYFATVDVSTPNNGRLFSSKRIFVGFSGPERLPKDDIPFITCDFWDVDDDRDYFRGDGLWNVARGFANIASILSLIAFITGCCLACMSCNMGCIKFVSAMLWIAAVISPITFVAFNSDFCKEYDCEFSIGAGFAIFCPIVLGLAGFAYCKIPPYGEAEQTVFAQGQPVENSPSPGSVQVTQEVMADGTKKTIKTTINADGSRTVEETVERPVTVVVE